MWIKVVFNKIRVIGEGRGEYVCVFSVVEGWLDNEFWFWIY